MWLYEPSAGPIRRQAAPSELFSVRDAMRELNRIVDKLQRGEIEQAVLMKGTKMVAVITAVPQ